MAHSVAEFIDNPNWVDIYSELKDAPKKRHLPAHEDCSHVDAELAARHLMRGGTLGKMPNYEERPGQIDMLRAIVRAFNNRHHLMIEAGTGVGKSLAYLIPSIIWSHYNDTPVIVSTATRNLQSQLINSDIPKALNVLGEDRKNFKVALLKGRTNYLCLRAVTEFFAAGFWTMTEEDQKEMPNFINWLKTTTDGDLDDYDGLPHSLLTCTSEECSARRCQYYSRCFVFKARKLASEAHLVVANHSLVLADAVGGGILPNYGRLIIDEAHNLESIATEHLSVVFSVPILLRILNRLIRKGRGKRAAPGGILSSVDRQLQKGVLAGNPVANKIATLVKNATSSAVRVIASAEDLADDLALLLKPADEPILRYKVENGVRKFSLHGLFAAYDPEEWKELQLKTSYGKFENDVALLVNLLHELRDDLLNSVPENEFNYCYDLAVQAEGIANSLVNFTNDTNFVIAAQKDTHVYWVERVKIDKKNNYIQLVGAPLSVAAELNELFWDVKDSVVLSSATLRVGNDFKYSIKRLGVNERTDALVATSPFDYFSQSLVLAPDCLPDPAEKPAEYAAELSLMMKDLFKTTRGRALVLFTSYEMMSRVAECARPFLEKSGIELLVQGEGRSRESLARALKTSDGHTVVFGAQSFWEGVDIAGDALSCVVITRLPFAQVGNPITEGRAEQIKNANGSPFKDYTLPEAVIKFRQGFGRLIRTKRDRGVVVITDPRIVTKSYGATFRHSIPTSVHTVTSIPELVERVESFFNG